MTDQAAHEDQCTPPLCAACGCHCHAQDAARAELEQTRTELGDRQATADCLRAGLADQIAETMEVATELATERTSHARTLEQLAAARRVLAGDAPEAAGVWIVPMIDHRDRPAGPHIRPNGWISRAAGLSDIAHTRRYAAQLLAAADAAERQQAIGDRLAGQG